MAFLDETGLAELWSLVKAEDAKGAKIATGSYKGTGTYGEENPNSLAFDFAPQLVWIYAFRTDVYLRQITQYSTNSSYYTGNFIVANEVTTQYTYYTAPYMSGNGEDGRCKKSEDGKTFWWYNTSTAESQLNASGYSYYYIAFG